MILENRTFSELQPGDSAELTRTCTADDVDSGARPATGGAAPASRGTLGGAACVQR